MKTPEDIAWEIIEAYVPETTEHMDRKIAESITMKLNNWLSASPSMGAEALKQKNYFYAAQLCEKSGCHKCRDMLRAWAKKKFGSEP